MGIYGFSQHYDAIVNLNKSYCATENVHKELVLVIDLHPLLHQTIYGNLTVLSAPSITQSIKFIVAGVCDRILNIIERLKILWPSEKDFNITDIALAIEGTAPTAKKNAIERRSIEKTYKVLNPRVKREVQDEDEEDILSFDLKKYVNDIVTQLLQIDFTCLLKNEKRKYKYKKEEKENKKEEEEKQKIIDNIILQKPLKKRPYSRNEDDPNEPTAKREKASKVVQPVMTSLCMLERRQLEGEIEMLGAMNQFSNKALIFVTPDTDIFPLLHGLDGYNGNDVYIFKPRINPRSRQIFVH
jgi:hypothetical protein